MMVVRLSVNRRWPPVRQALTVMSEEQLRDALTWAVYGAVAACDEDVSDVAVMWGVRDAHPTEPLLMEITAGDWQPMDPRALWVGIQEAVLLELRDIGEGGLWRVAGPLDLTLVP